MPKTMYKAGVYIGVLLCDPPIGQESRIQALKNLNWHNPFRWLPAKIVNWYM